jgi:hypothetical protein
MLALSLRGGIADEAIQCLRLAGFLDCRAAWRRLAMTVRNFD